MEGDTVYQMNLKSNPCHIRWSSVTKGNAGNSETVISMVLNNGKSLYFHNLKNPDSPFQLSFQTSYGSIVKYEWIADKFIVIAFAHGTTIVISADLNEIGNEVFQVKEYKDYQSDIALSTSLNRVATCGDNAIKVHDMNDMNVTSYFFWPLVHLLGYFESHLFRGRPRSFR